MFILTSLMNMNPRPKKQKRILNILAKIAEDVVSVSNARLAAAIVHKNEIISIGINQMKSHPMQAKYSKHEQCIYIHAEIDAIVKATKKIGAEKLKNCSLYISRVKKNNAGEYLYGLAKPCEGCCKAIAAFDIKNVYWTEDSE